MHGTLVGNTGIWWKTRWCTIVAVAVLVFFCCCYLCCCSIVCTSWTNFSPKIEPITIIVDHHFRCDILVLYMTLLLLLLLLLLFLLSLLLLLLLLMLLLHFSNILFNLCWSSNSYSLLLLFPSIIKTIPITIIILIIVLYCCYLTHFFYQYALIIHPSQKIRNTIYYQYALIIDPLQKIRNQPQISKIKPNTALLVFILPEWLWTVIDNWNWYGHVF